MKCSTCVGTLTTKRELYKEVSDETNKEVLERYYLTELLIDGESYPAVGSEFILRDFEGKVEVKKYLRTESGGQHGSKLFTFIQIITCKKVSENTPDVNHITMGGTIVKSRGILPSRNSGMENLPFILRYSSYDKNRNIAHCVARESNARRLSLLAIGDILEFDGVLKINKGTIEVVVSTIILHKPKGKR
jgi:hypothetical protein